MGYENVLIIIMLVGLVLFGSKRLPELARAIGRSQMEFEMARSQATKEAQKEIRHRDLALGDVGSDEYHRLYRAKLEKAALRAGVQDPKRLADEELVHAVNLYLEER
jgi:sec-independent protein translocase protein TatA